jgi:hypothetical protein
MSNVTVEVTVTDPVSAEISTAGQVTIELTAGTVGPQGPAGTPGAPGAPGAAGVGVPVGGTTNQLLAKVSGTDYDTEWKTVTLAASTTVAILDWTGAGPYTAVKTVSGILTTDKPFADLDLSAVLFADVADVQGQWALVYRVESSDANEITFYATESPTEEFTVSIKVVR